MFVTDDGKDDWWWKIESDGPKTVGPRPELVEEARSVGGIETLLMYNPEGFLKFAKQFLKAPVSDETLKEVRDVSKTRVLRDANFRDLRESAQRAEQAVLLWLEGRFDRVQENRLGFPDFVAERDGKTFGFEVKMVPNPRMVIHRLREIVYRAYYEINESRLSEITIVWVVGSHLEADELKQALYRPVIDQMPDALRMIIGAVVDPEAGEGGFFPFEEFSYEELSLKSRFGDARNENGR